MHVVGHVRCCHTLAKLADEDISSIPKCNADDACTPELHTRGAVVYARMVQK